VVGKGGFGKVWKVSEKSSGKVFAMKEMQKVKIISKRSVHSVMNEQALLQKLKNPFIVNMAHSFQDRENLFLVMDYCNRGDLRYFYFHSDTILVPAANLNKKKHVSFSDASFSPCNTCTVNELSTATSNLKTSSSMIRDTCG
jgi:serine/threonine protein kinase